MAKYDSDEAEAAVEDALNRPSMTKIEREKFTRRVLRLAQPLPDLPSDASVLAQQVHERSQAMLKLKIANVETTVSQLFDRMIKEVVEEAVSGAIRATVRQLAQKCADAAVPAAVAQLIAELSVSQETCQYIKEDAARRFNAAVREKADAKIKAVAQPAAEVLVREALGEVQRYYGATALLVEDGGEKGCSDP